MTNWTTVKSGTTSTTTVTVQAGQKMNESFLLEAHGFDPNLWHIVNVTSNYWGKTSDSHCQFQTKIKVIPKSFNSQHLINTTNTKSNSISLTKSKLKKYGFDETLILPFFDMHFGITTYSYISKYLPDIYDVIDRGYKKIILLIGDDYFHSDFMSKTKIANNRRLDHFDNEQSFVDGTQFLRDVIRRCYDITDEISIYNISDIHDSGKLYLWMKAMQEHYRGTSIDFHVTLKPRAAFKISNVGIMLQNENVVRDHNSMLFASKFADIWETTMSHYIFTEHYHKQATTENDDAAEIQFAIPKPTKRYEQNNGCYMQLKLFTFNKEHLTATYYIQH